MTDNPASTKRATNVYDIHGSELFEGDIVWEQRLQTYEQSSFPEYVDFIEKDAVSILSQIQWFKGTEHEEAGWILWPVKPQYYYTGQTREPAGWVYLPETGSLNIVGTDDPNSIGGKDDYDEDGFYFPKDDAGWDNSCYEGMHRDDIEKIDSVERQ